MMVMLVVVKTERSKFVDKFKCTPTFQNFVNIPQVILKRRHVKWQTHITTHPLHIQFVCVHVQYKMQNAQKKVKVT